MKALLVLLVVLMSRLAMASEIREDGAALLESCGPTVAATDGLRPFEGKSGGEATKMGLDGAFCQGLATGIVHATQAYQFLNYQTLFCVPEGGITTGQAVRVIVKYLRDHPEELHLRGSLVAIQALRQAFPCKSK
jgi:hypothetical protein